VSRASAAAVEPAADLPVARVALDVSLPHLDRPFDYLVPARLDAEARPGVRVRVRFAGKLTDGYLVERVAASAHEGRLAPLERVVSPEPVLAAPVYQLARDVAGRYAGTVADVLRLAVPPRHARAEKSPGPDSPAAAPDPAASPAWTAYPDGPAYLAAVAAGRPARAVLTARPREDWPALLAGAAAAARTGGRGALLLVPDARDLDRLDAALAARLGADGFVSLSAALGPEERYRRFLRVARGEVGVVAGTRGAAFAPVHRLGLVAMWDDGDDSYAEPRAPYPHAREVLLTRALTADCAVLLAGFARTVEAQLLVETGWAREVALTRTALREVAPAVLPTGDDTDLARDPAAAAARLPSAAWKAARDALAAGDPVLVQVPRRGYLPAVCCARCRAPARCPHCAGPLALGAADSAATCRWCGRTAAGYACPACGSRRLRAAVTGARRTAEELGRVFAGVPVRTSGRDGVLATVAPGPGLVVSTPGAEPVPEGPGYGAVLLLDTWALLTRADLRAGEETLRRWMAAAALARPAAQGGRVVVVADGGLAPVQALIRWDPAWLAARELAERRELGFPPAVRVATVTGPAAAVGDLLAAAHLPEGTQQLGPVPRGPDEERMLLRTSRSAGRAMAEALHAAAGTRSARKAREPVRVQVDPLDLL
jgi:primosomal protein N' (replication factor Y)